jgi:glycosyltransferase involved in cell wall biosynthesis
MIPRILHLLSQRPGYTGSGVTLQSLVRQAEAGGWDQHAVVGTPASDPCPEVGGLSPERIHPVLFEKFPLTFAVPGMSDVMPYPSSRFSRLRPEQLRNYRQAFRGRILQLVRDFQPHVIHSHHVWLMSSQVKEVAPRVPLVIQCHATGLRQIQLCPPLLREVRAGCSRADAFVVLNRTGALQLMRAIGVPEQKIHVIPAGYREEFFHPHERAVSPGPELVYVGKFAAAKGLPSLLDAVEALAPSVPGLRLHVAGQGGGQEALDLAARMEAMPQVLVHGQLSQVRLGELMRRSALCVLPSFYEGIPMVLIEALACGCRVVSTDLPGVREEIHPLAPEAVDLVPLPRLVGPDQPRPEDLPAFVERLTEALRGALTKPMPSPPNLLDHTALAAYLRMQEVWMAVSASRSKP